MLDKSSISGFKNDGAAVASQQKKSIKSASEMDDSQLINTNGSSANASNKAKV
jgi:hypothetical protein